jgi:hypothetical protein
MRRVALETLGDRTQAGVAKMVHEPVEARPDIRGRRPRPQERLHVGTREPCPGRPLVVGSVPPQAVAAIRAEVGRIRRRQRSEPQPDPERSRDHVDDGSRPLGVEEVGFEADREQLVRAKRGIVAGWPVHNVEEAAAIPVPEPRTEGRRGPLAKAGMPRGSRLVAALPAEAGNDPARVDPEGLDLDRLACPQRYDPIADLGIHPGKLDTRLGSVRRRDHGRRRRGPARRARR